MLFCVLQGCICLLFLHPGYLDLTFYNFTVARHVTTCSMVGHHVTSFSHVEFCIGDCSATYIELLYSTVVIDIALRLLELFYRMRSFIHNTLLWSFTC